MEQAVGVLQVTSYIKSERIYMKNLCNKQWPAHCYCCYRDNEYRPKMITSCCIYYIISLKMFE